MKKKCLLEKPNCYGSCANCGWNPSEVKRREELFIKNGLTLCDDGMERLIIKPEGK